MSLSIKERLKLILNRLKKRYPQVSCALTHHNAFELLVATILSAQCTDIQVNKVTPALFKRYPTPQALAHANPVHLESMVRSTGFYHNKSKNLKAMATRLVADFKGQVPDNMEALLSLPGVARKTANVVLGDWFGQAEGIVVDTHVKRISRLLDLTQSTQPPQIEKDLMLLLPRKEWIGFPHRLILLGREICIARRPKCPLCPLNDCCPSAVLT